MVKQFTLTEFKALPIFGFEQTSWDVFTFETKEILFKRSEQIYIENYPYYCTRADLDNEGSICYTFELGKQVVGNFLENVSKIINNID